LKKPYSTEVPIKKKIVRSVILIYGFSSGKIGIGLARTNRASTRIDKSNRKILSFIKRELFFFIFYK